MPTITSSKGTGNLSTNRVRISMAEGIALLNPNENPFTLLTQKYSKIAIGSYIRRWLTDVLRPEVDQINYSTGYASDATSLVVDNGDYFAVGDLHRVFDSGEVLLTTAISTDTLTVTRNWPGAGSGEPGYNVALVDDDYLEFIGNVNEEGATAPAAIHTLEVEYSNLSQIQRTVLELTNTDIAMLMHGEQDLPYEVRKKGIEHARKVEFQHLFGGKPKSDTSGTHPKRGAAGIWWFLRKYGDADRVKSESEITESEFMTWIMHCFRYGSPTKFLYAPPLLIEAISRWGYAKLELHMGEETGGIAIHKWATPHGNTINIINHKMLEGPAVGTAGGHAFLLDMNDIKYCHVRGRDTALLMGREANDADKKKQEYLVESTLQMKNFKHHGYLYGFTSFAA